MTGIYYVPEITLHNGGTRICADVQMELSLKGECIWPNILDLAKYFCRLFMDWKILLVIEAKNVIAVWEQILATFIKIMIHVSKFLETVCIFGLVTNFL